MKEGRNLYLSWNDVQKMSEVSCWGWDEGVHKSVGVIKRTLPNASSRTATVGPMRLSGSNVKAPSHGKHGPLTIGLLRVKIQLGRF